jgi:hypothetical protein
MIGEVVVVSILLEMVATAVGNNAAVNDVDLTHRPAVEPRLREKFLQQSMIAHLDAASAQA